jgi:hypothetical protein
VGALAVIRVIFDVQQGADGVIFDPPIQQVMSAPAGSSAPRATQHQQRPEQQPQHRPTKECTCRTK